MISGKSKSKEWRKRIYFLIFLSILAPTLMIGVMLYFFLSTDIENRRTMSFMNFEQQTYRVQDLLKQQTEWVLESNQGTKYLKFSSEPRALLRLDAQGVTKIFGGLTNEEEKKIAKAKKSSENLVIWKVSGQRFVLRQLYIGEPTKFGQTELAVGRYAAVWNVQFNQLKQAFANDTQALYLLTRESSVAFAAPDTMVDQDILQRPLVQEFIKSPLSRAVTGIRNSKEGPQYYFYMVVPETNLVLFVESDATRLFLPLFRPAAIILSLLVVLLGFILMIWKNITGSLTDQTLALSEALEDFSRGLLIPTQLEEQEFSKELHPLVLSINQTTRGIRERIDLIEKKKS